MAAPTPQTRLDYSDLRYNGTTPTQVRFNGTTLSRLQWNGVDKIHQEVQSTACISKLGVNITLPTTCICTWFDPCEGWELDFAIASTCSYNAASCCKPEARFNYRNVGFEAKCFTVTNCSLQDYGNVYLLWIRERVTDNYTNFGSIHAENYYVSVPFGSAVVCPITLECYPTSYSMYSDVTCRGSYYQQGSFATRLICRIIVYGISWTEEPDVYIGNDRWDGWTFTAMGTVNGDSAARISISTPSFEYCRDCDLIFSGNIVNNYCSYYNGSPNFLTVSVDNYWTNCCFSGYLGCRNY